MMTSSLSDDDNASLFLKAPGMDAGDVAKHGFFSRQGGVSNPPYETLNTGPGSGDDQNAISENRRICMAALDIEPDRLLTLYQVHSAKAVIVNEPWTGAPPKADALVTNEPGLAIGVLTADCMPFLFVDPKAKIIAAAHAGWRGALDGVLEATIDQMVNLGAAPSNIKAALGPCLRQDNFEVGLDMVALFTSNFKGAARFFTAGVNDEKRQFDLAGFGRWRLAALGVNNLEDLAICTLGESAAYFSYRASKRAGEADYGRNLSAIALL